MKTYVVYHQNCYDGFGAAWVASKVLPKDTIFIPASYGNPVPDFEPGSEIYILDFSYPRDVMIGINFLSKKTVVLDHHATAFKNCEGLDFCHFDMNRSGAGMTWDYFHPGEDRPALINYIEDRDLWRYKLPESREVFEWYSSYPMDFETWDNINASINKHLGAVMEEGAAILRKTKQRVEAACQEVMWMTLEGHEVPVVNVPYTMGSDVCERLLELHPKAPFAAYYFAKSNGVQQWGLRAREWKECPACLGEYNGVDCFVCENNSGRVADDVDVSKIAEAYGGGGHKKAAGFLIQGVMI